MVGAGEAGSAVFVESLCENPEIKDRHVIEPKKIFLNIVLELKFKNGKGIAC